VRRGLFGAYPDDPLSVFMQKDAARGRDLPSSRSSRLSG